MIKIANAQPWVNDQDEALDVDDMARAAGLSRAHFSREFRRAFGEAPHQYLLTRRLERAASLLRTTDRSVADICFSVGLQSVGSFTSSFTKTYGVEEGVMSSFPVRLRGGSWEIDQGLDVGDFARAKIDATVAELVEERDAVRQLGLV